MSIRSLTCWCALVATLFVCARCAVAAEMGTLAYLDEKNGFRDVEFGMTPEQVPGKLQLKEKDDLAESSEWIREGDKLEIGSAHVKLIRYVFFRNKLARVLIFVIGLDNRQALFGYFTTAFGKPVPDYDFMAATIMKPGAEAIENAWIWEGKKVHLRDIERSDGTAFVEIGDRVLAAELEKQAAAKKPERERAREKAERERLKQLEKQNEF